MGAVIVALVGALMVFLHSGPLGDELVVVMPSADGHLGMVVVERGGERAVLNGPFAASRIVAGGAPVAERLPESEVRAEFASALQALPDS